ncbi:hypothetical protein ACFQV8_20470 [Pseudonocardia benzenivorans]
MPWTHCEVLPWFGNTVTSTPARCATSCIAATLTVLNTLFVSGMM